MQTKPAKHSKRYIHFNKGSDTCVLMHFPHFFNKHGSEKSKARENEYDFNNMTLANPTLVQPDF